MAVLGGGEGYSISCEREGTQQQAKIVSLQDKDLYMLSRGALLIDPGSL